jgi:hypothetical protein
MVDGHLLLPRPQLLLGPSKDGDVLLVLLKMLLLGALLVGVGVQFIRRRAKRKPDEDHLPAFATCATARQCDRLPR